MATQPEELIGTPIEQSKRLRVYAAPDGIQPGLLAALAADTDLPHMTPLTFASGTGHWSVWTDADAEVHGFLFTDGAEDHKGLLAGETSIAVFKKGTVDGRDIPLPTGQTQGTLETALKTAGLRDRGVVVTGLAGVA